jgi:hypothetical protein
MRLLCPPLRLSRSRGYCRLTHIANRETDSLVVIGNGAIEVALFQLLISISNPPLILRFARFPRKSQGEFVPCLDSLPPG